MYTAQTEETAISVRDYVYVMMALEDQLANH
jgi:hypothetical protein